MIKFTAYRWIKAVLGSRSFKKINNGRNLYALVKGDSTKIVNILISQGFVEEWPRDDRIIMEEDNG